MDNLDCYSAKLFAEALQDAAASSTTLDDLSAALGQGDLHSGNALTPNSQGVARELDIRSALMLLLLLLGPWQDFHLL